MIDPASLSGHLIDGRYRLAYLLGTGAFGWVYAADDEGVDPVRQVAVKLMRPQDDASRAAVLRDTAALTGLDHPHILRAYGSGRIVGGELNDAVYIAMELGWDTLQARLLKARLSAADALVVARHIASALAYLSDRKPAPLVHRDVKPANLMLVGSDWKLGDCGLMRGLQGSVLKSSGRKGSPAYMAPEAVTDNQLSPAVDVWGLGALLQESVTGIMPYASDTELALVRACLTLEPTIVPDLPQSLDSVVRGCLVKDPVRRWTAREVLRVLDGGTPPPERGASPTHESVPRPKAPSPGKARGELRTNPVDGAEMVYIAAGEFLMGDSDQSDNPRHTVRLSGYWMYRNVVTVAQYKRFCAATTREMPPEPSYSGIQFNPGWSKEDHPIVNVSWHDASAYAQWAKAELPTEAQWEKAARGTDGQKYPWGDTWDASKCWCSENTYGDAGGTHAVGELGVSPYGCTDMAGNVWQWCRDWYDKEYWKIDRGLDPAGPGSGTNRVRRGGSWYSYDPDDVRAAYRDVNYPTYRNFVNGFRCVVRADS